MAAIKLNGESYELANEPTTVASLLVELSLADRPTAVEVNQALVPKREHAQVSLSDGDCVEIVTLVGGG